MSCIDKGPAACLEAVPNAIEDGLKKATDSVIGNVVEAFAKALGHAADQLLTWLNHLWIGINGDGSASSISTIQDEMNWVVGYVAVASLLFAAIRMALERKGESMIQAFQGMWRVILVSAVATGAVQALTAASDAYAEYLYGKADLGDSGATVVGTALGTLWHTSPGLVIVFGLITIVAAFVQAILMILRIGVLVMLVGTLPVAAAASMTGWGGGWWKKHVGWLTAWLLYKPAAALIFFSGKVMTGGGGGKGNEHKITEVIAGLGVLLLAVVALPALLKLVAPATAALGGTSGGSITMNAADSLATGAIKLVGGSGGGGGGGGGGPEGSPSSGGASSEDASGAGGGGAGGGGGGGGGAGGAAAEGAGAAGDAATAGATKAVRAGLMVAKTGMDAANEVANSFEDNDGNKGHNE